ncbi:MAG: hypothetical protein WC680_00155 [Sulfuricurvum sp.]|jgi:hypothetical protein
MSDFPLHPTLFFSLSIMLGLVLSYFFTIADLIDKKDKKFIIVNLFLYGSWIVAALFAIYIIYLIETNQPRAIAFAPLGMMIAALIASASVMKSIAETKANEAIKHKKDEEKAAKEKERKESFVLNVVETIYIISDSIPTDLVNGDIFNFKNNANTQIDAMSRLLDLVFIENVVSYLNREQQIFLAELHRAFYTYKSKPLPQEANGSVLFEATYLLQAIQEMMKKVNAISERYITTFSIKKDDA